MKIATMLVACCAFATVAAQADPAENISKHRHPNLARAQELTGKAYDAATAAQTANEFDMDGHAEKAKELLSQASSELKAAAEAANHK
jgi:hypothetical protein